MNEATWIDENSGLCVMMDNNDCLRDTCMKRECGDESSLSLSLPEMQGNTSLQVRSKLKASDGVKKDAKSNESSGMTVSDFRLRSA